MSNSVFNRICHAQLKPSEKTVLLILASIANDDGSTQKFAPIGRIMAYSCMSRRTVTYSLRALEDAGIIATTAKHGEIPTYFINPNFAPAPSKGCEDLAENPFEIAESAPRANAAPVQIMQNNEQYLHEGGASVAWGGANIDNKTAIFAPYTSTSFTPLTPSTSAGDFEQEKTVKPKIDHMRHFDQFYTAYPRKIGKENARKAWLKLKVDDDLLSVILAALKTQSIGWTDPKFIPHPATWLNGKRWEDQTVIVATTQPQQPVMVSTAPPMVVRTGKKTNLAALDAIKI